MKVNYERLVELNKEALTADSGQMSCFYLIQQGLERYLGGETIANEYINFLIQVGVLEPENQEEKKIVKPFNFMGNDGPEGN
jgi:hypothetical protein